MTELSVGQFDALVARKLAPLSVRKPSQGWGTFSADDALAIALFGALTRTGLAQHPASALVRSEYEDLLAYSNSGSSGDIWLGAYRSTAHKAGESSASATFPIISVFADIEVTVRQTQERAGDADPVEGMTIINATAVVRRMLLRATEAGIEDRRLTALAKLLRAV
ncbi:MAG: hypothetical protein EON59_06175 [Alphaproteobacteria bacterium]|nr:MAG: hypothetical protein EON59_06175 [Alphaproteobacteria bacterium]